MGVLEGLFYMIWRGIAIGVIVSAPMGPVGILCIQRTLERGRRTGFHTGIGAALSDLFYCLLTGFGLSFIEEFLKSNQNIIQIVGSVVLIGFGVYLFRSNPTRRLKRPEHAESSPGKNILSGFLFTFSNPLIIFLIIGLFARFNFLLPEIRFYQYMIGYAGIFAGAILWWWLVSFFVNKVRGHFNLRSMWLINKIIGSIIMIFALVGIFTAVTGIANAAERPARFLNSVRGFGTYAPAGAPLTLANDGADTLRVTFTVPGNTSSASMRLQAQLNRDWQMQLLSDHKLLPLTFRISDDATNPESPAELILSGAASGAAPVTQGGNGWLSLRITLSPEGLILSAGDREYNTLATLPLAAMPDSIAFLIPPRRSMLADWIEFEEGKETTPAPGSYDFSDSDVRQTYLARSKDSYTGIWTILDMSLDDSMLRTGGDYTLMLAGDSKQGYSLIYLSGALVSPSSWTPGRLKATLAPSPVPGIYDVTWTDASGAPLPSPAKAQFTGERGKASVLSITFPGMLSSLRLCRVNTNFTDP